MGGDQEPGNTVFLGAWLLRIVDGWGRLCFVWKKCKVDQGNGQSVDDERRRRWGGRGEEELEGGGGQLETRNSTTDLLPEDDVCNGIPSKCSI